MWQIIENPSWENIRTSFDWIQDMEGVPQSPIYHAEGDVAIHTKMVLEALLALEEYQQLEGQSQAILFAAALLHDVEKRSTTVIEDDGQITSKGHAKRGALTARALLYRQHKTPFIIKEQISNLVRYHGLPFWIFEKPSPEKALFQASLQVNTHWLYILAKADMLGRICPDKENMLYKLELFRAFCEEHDCYGKVKSFTSDFGRYTYFRKDIASPNYLPYEEDCFEVLLLSALPGTGKDTFLRKQYPDLPVVSIDALRRKHKIAPTNKKGNGQMVQRAKEQAREYLRKRQSFAWNATNITRNMRTQMIDLFQTYGAKTTLVYLEVPYTQLLTQNRNRAYPIPRLVLEKMVSKIEIPSLSEAPKVLYNIVK